MGKWLNRTPRCWRRVGAAIFATLLYVVLASGPFNTITLGVTKAPKPKSHNEYEVKAAFLFNFAKYTTWPPSAFANDQAPITIGIIGDDPFHSALDNLIKHKTVNGRRFAVRRSHRVKDLDGCQIIFVSRSETHHLAAVVSEYRRRPILTVSDVREFAKQGGVIELREVHNKVRFTINIDAAKRVALKLSSQLLELARVVHDSAPEKGR